MVALQNEHSTTGEVFEIDIYRDMRTLGACEAFYRTINDEIEGVEKDQKFFLKSRYRG